MKFSVVWWMIMVLFLSEAVEGVFFRKQQPVVVPEPATPLLATKFREASSLAVKFQKAVESWLRRTVTPLSGAAVIPSSPVRVASLSQIGPRMAIVGRSLQRQWQQKLDDETAFFLLMNVYASLLPASILEEFIAANLLNGVLSGNKQRQMILQTWIGNLQLAARLFLSSQMVEMGSMAVWDILKVEGTTGIFGKNHLPVALSSAYKQTVFVLFLANRLHHLIQVTLAAKTMKKNNDRIRDDKTSSFLSFRHLAVSLFGPTRLSFLVVLAAGCSIGLIWERNFGHLSTTNGWGTVAISAILAVVAGTIVPMGRVIESKDSVDANLEHFLLTSNNDDDDSVWYSGKYRIIHAQHQQQQHLSFPFLQRQPHTPMMQGALMALDNLDDVVQTRCATTAEPLESEAVQDDPLELPEDGSALQAQYFEPVISIWQAIFRALQSVTTVAGSSSKVVRTL